ncbi:RING/FYVE/PHD zinc finger superfamily protein [Quillaja saponaria]|nr:RING/FYVE/PHD zinc finger superfamily protein [Quillaja saponaria]
MNSKMKMQILKDQMQKKNTAINPAFDDNKKRKNSSILFKSLSFNASSNKPNANDSEVLPTNSPRVDALKKLKCAKERSLFNGKCTSELRSPAVCVPISGSGVTTARCERDSLCHAGTLFSGSNSHKVDAVSCLEKSSTISKASSHVTQKGLNQHNKEQSNEGCHAQHTTEAAFCIKENTLCISVFSDEKPSVKNVTQFEAIHFLDSAIPVLNYIWIGNFQMLRNGGFQSSYDGIQAHLSTSASPKIPYIVKKLPKNILLEEVPRLSIWPSQFLDRHARDDDIALYFFAKDLESYRRDYTRLLESMTKNDLALKGNFHGFELLIFPSNVLTERSQYWNRILFLWGVFRERRVGVPAYMPTSHSQKEEQKDTVRKCGLDLKPCLRDEEENTLDRPTTDGGKSRKIDGCSGDTYKFYSKGTESSGDRILLGLEGYGPNFPGEKKANREWRGQVQI